MLKFVAMHHPMYKRKKLKKYQNGGLNNPTGILNVPTFDTSSVLPENFGTTSNTTSGYDPTADIISGVGTAAGGLAGLFGTGKKAQAGEQANIDAAAGDISSFYGTADAGGYDYNFSLDPAYQELYTLSKQAPDLDPLQRREAQALNLLETTGQRGVLSKLQSVLDSSADQEAQLNQQALENEMKGLANLGQQRQQLTTAAEEANQSFRRDLGLRQLEQAEMAQAQGQENLANMKADRRGAFGDIASGVLSAATSALLPNILGGNAEFGGLVPQMEYGGKLYEDGGLAKLAPPYDEVTQKDVLVGRGVFEAEEGEHGMKMMPGGGLMDMMPGGGIMAEIMGAQGQPPVQGPFPGEASHETNPIHMINNQGEKVAEAMGGEYLINDKQAELIVEDYRAIEKAIEDGREPSKDELMELYESCKQVFGQPQFQDDAEAEMQMT